LRRAASLSGDDFLRQITTRAALERASPEKIFEEQS
jgi:hypothetical protein